MYYYAVSNTNDELTHYGVIGMKWGVRKANRYAKSASKAAAKGNTEKASKMSAKASAQSSKNNRRQDFSERRKSVSKSRTLGSKALVLLLTGFFGNRTYDSVRTAGYSKAAAFGAAFATGYLTGPLGNVIVTGQLERNYGKGN